MFSSFAGPEVFSSFADADDHSCTVRGAGPDVFSSFAGADDHSCTVRGAGPGDPVRQDAVGGSQVSRAVPLGGRGPPHATQRLQEVQSGKEKQGDNNFYFNPLLHRKTNSFAIQTFLYNAITM